MPRYRGSGNLISLPRYILLPGEFCRRGQIFMCSPDGIRKFILPLRRESVSRLGAMKREPGENPGQTRCCESHVDSFGFICHCRHSRAMGRLPKRRDKSEDLPSSYIVLKFSGNRTSEHHRGLLSVLGRWGYEN